METILIVDDAEINRDILRMIFEEQYIIIETGDGEEAIEYLKERGQDISLVLLDLMMPKKNGLEVLAFMRLSELKEQIPVMMITGESTVESDVKAYEYGADDIIYKPFEPKIVMRRVMNLIELYSQRRDMETKLYQRTIALRESQEKLAKNNEFLVNALGSVVEFRSLESGQHIQRVSGFTRILLQYVKSNFLKYKLLDEQIKMIASAAALHDVGKIGIPDAILNKPGKLTEQERKTMRRHTKYGCEILERFKQADTEFYRYCYEICRWHHEKADGKGYPDGLTEAETPIWAQAVAVADCFDALVSKRVYKEAYAVSDAYSMILRGECGKFGDDIMYCFQLARYEFFNAVEFGFSYSATSRKMDEVGS